MIICGDALTELRKLPDESVHCCVTSPPYWGLRDYGIEGQLGLEKTPEKYVTKLVEVLREVRRALRKDGTLWLNLGDSYVGGKGMHGTSKALGNAKDRGYTQSGGTVVMALRPQDRVPAGLKPKDLVGIPWRVAFALQVDGWYLRSDIIWAKKNCMPESVKDRPTRSHEYIFLLSKSKTYYYDFDSIKEPAIYFDDDRVGRAREDNKRMPTDMISGIRPRKAVYKDAAIYNGKNSDKQRGHSRRHASFNDRWDTMTKKQQCSAMRNKRDVWIIATASFPEAHFATFPPALIEPMIKAGCPLGGIVLDPFFGAGTTGLVAKQLGRDFIGIELNQKYCEMAEKRIAQASYQAELGMEAA